MLISLLSPAVLATVLAYCFTFVLRHRLYVYAATYRPRHGEVAHVFVIQNLEIIDLDIPLQLQISTVNNVGRIRRISLDCGMRGPTEWPVESGEAANEFGGFLPDGPQRFVRVSYGVSALDTWRIECRTNDDVKEVRLVIRGWDLRKKRVRWWIPSFQRGGVRITSRTEDVLGLYTRPVRAIALVLIALMVYGYLYTVTALAGIAVGGGLPFPLSRVAEYVASVSYPFEAPLDLTIAIVLAALGILAWRLVMRSHWHDVSLGYLGDPFLMGLAGERSRRPGPGGRPTS